MAVDSGYHGNLVVPTPAPIAAFVRAFDEGAYPDLVQSTVLRQTNNIVVVSEGETEIIPLPDPEPLAA